METKWEVGSGEDACTRSLICISSKIAAEKEGGREGGRKEGRERREGGRGGREGGREEGREGEEGGRGENKGRVNSGMKREQSSISHSATHPHQSTNSTDLNV